MLLRTTLLTSAALVLMACGAEPIPLSTVDAGTPDGGTSVQPDAGTPDNRIVIRVLAGDAPADGAIVAFDPSDDFRREMPTDEDGVVVFDDIDWDRAQPADLTVYRPGCRISSYVGLTRADYDEAVAASGHGIAEIGLVCEGAEPTVPFRGIAQNMRSPNNQLALSTTAGGAHQARGPNWELMLPEGTPFTAVALEFFPVPLVNRTVSWRGFEQVFVGWTIATHPGGFETATFELDFDDVVTSTVRVSASAPVPEDSLGNLFSTGYPYVTVYDEGGHLFMGASVWVDVDDTMNTMEFVCEYIELEGVPLETRYFMLSERGAWSQVRARGAPTAAQAAGVEFLEPPVLVDHHSGSVMFDAPIRWEGRAADVEDPEVATAIYLFDWTGRHVWSIQLQPGATEVHLPLLPSGIELEQLSPDGSFAAYLQLAEVERDDDGIALVRQAQAPRFVVLFD